MKLFIFGSICSAYCDISNPLEISCSPGHTTFLFYFGKKTVKKFTMCPKNRVFVWIFKKWQNFDKKHVFCVFCTRMSTDFKKLVLGVFSSRLRIFCLDFCWNHILLPIVFYDFLPFCDNVRIRWNQPKLTFALHRRNSLNSTKSQRLVVCQLKWQFFETFHLQEYL